MPIARSNKLKVIARSEATRQSDFIKWHPYPGPRSRNYEQKQDQGLKDYLQKERIIHLFYFQFEFKMDA